MKHFIKINTISIVLATIFIVVFGEMFVAYKLDSAYEFKRYFFHCLTAIPFMFLWWIVFFILNRIFSQCGFENKIFKISYFLILSVSSLVFVTYLVPKNSLHFETEFERMMNEVFSKPSDMQVNDFKTNLKDIDGDPIPNMPDEKLNNSTLLGVDSDNDGVRDDVELWINRRYQSETSEIRKIAKEVAKLSTKRLLNVSNRKVSNQITKQILNLQDCFDYRLSKSGKTENEILNEIIQMDILLFNTKQRIDHDEQASRNFHGVEVELLSLEELCE